MRQIYFTSLFILLVWFQLSGANKTSAEFISQPNDTEKYCQIQTKYCHSDFHPLCNEPAKIFLRSNAANIEFLELSDANKSDLLMEINKFRNKLAAGAIHGFKSGSNIRIVKWSSQFAKLAEAYDKYNSFCSKISIDNSEFLEAEEFLDEDDDGRDFYKKALRQKVADSYGNSLWNVLFRAEFNRIGCAWSYDKSESSYKLFCYTNRNEPDNVEFDEDKAYKRGKSCTECGGTKCHEQFTHLCDDFDQINVKLPDLGGSDIYDDAYSDEDEVVEKVVDWSVFDDVIQTSGTGKYCQIQAKYCKIDFHPLCKEPAKIFEHPNAAHIEFLKLSDADKSYILMIINKFRNKLAAGYIPGHKSGSNFRVVNWSPQFTKLAEANDKYNSFCNKISIDNSEFLEAEELLDEDNVGPYFYKKALKQKVTDSYGSTLWHILFRAEFDRIGCAWSNDTSDISYKLFCYTNRNGDNAYKEGKSCTECGVSKCHLKFTNLCDVLQDPHDFDPINIKFSDLNIDIGDDVVVDKIDDDSNLSIYTYIGLAVLTVVIILIFLFVKSFKSGESYELKERWAQNDDMLLLEFCNE